MRFLREQIISGVGFRPYEFSEIMRMWMNLLVNASFIFLEFTDTTEFLAHWNANQLFDMLVLRLYGKATAASKVSELQHITQRHHELGLPAIMIYCTRHSRPTTQHI